MTGRWSDHIGHAMREARGGSEGLLQTFRGTGSVWLAPTQEIYQRLLAEFPNHDPLAKLSRERPVLG